MSGDVYRYCFAQVNDGRDLLQQNIRGGGFTDTTDSLIILSFIVLLALALFCWAYFLRKRPTEHQGAHVLVREKRRHSRDRSSRSSESSKSSDRPESSDTARRVRVRRRRREQKLHRNPTLEETGGLPPLRPEDSEPGSASTAQSVS